jgi:hypothetical protein
MIMQNLRSLFLDIDAEKSLISLGKRMAGLVPKDGGYPRDIFKGLHLKELSELCGSFFELDEEGKAPDISGAS